jgi:hypothetical protein
MPGDPDECRRHAARCAELAITAKSRELRLLLLEAAKWNAFADDTERIQALLAEDETCQPPAKQPPQSN